MSDLKILIIDDSEVIRFAYQAMLEKLNCNNLSFADGGEEGLRMFKEAVDKNDAYDLALIDFHMPDLYGQEVISLCRAHEKKHPGGKKSHIILTTTDDDKNNILDAMNSGADHYLIKPISLEDFNKLLVSLKNN